MTKISQCGRCRIGNGVHCMHYRPTDDCDCSFYEYGGEKNDDHEEESPLKNDAVKVVRIIATPIIFLSVMLIHDKVIASFVAFGILFLMLIGVIVYIWKK